MKSPREKRMNFSKSRDAILAVGAVEGMQETWDAWTSIWRRCKAILDGELGGV